MLPRGLRILKLSHRISSHFSAQVAMEVVSAVDVLGVENIITPIYMVNTDMTVLFARVQVAVRVVMVADIFKAICLRGRNQ